MSGISAHMIVKNEDRWVWFAIHSVLPYVDEFLITDTGSTDHTIPLIRSIHSSKIKLTIQKAATSHDVTMVRDKQLASSNYDWIWIVDADEIYPAALAQECVALTKSKQQLEGILVRRYDLLGDVYHSQSESVGSYHLFNQSGHLLVRLLNLKKLGKLTYRGDYPNEGLFDLSGNSILTHDPSLWHTTKMALYHAMYLKRSSLGGNLPMFNRSKYKIEKGYPVQASLPEVFLLPRPAQLKDPLVRRSLLYEISARIITPIKQLKRKLL